MGRNYVSRLYRNKLDFNRREGHGCDRVDEFRLLQVVYCLTSNPLGLALILLFTLVSLVSAYLISSGCSCLTPVAALVAQGGQPPTLQHPLHYFLFPAGMALLQGFANLVALQLVALLMAYSGSIVDQQVTQQQLAVLPALK